VEDLGWRERFRERAGKGGEEEKHFE